MRRVRARGRGDAAHAEGDAARARGPAAAGQAVDIDANARTTSEDRTLSQRTTYHGSGAVAFSTKGEYGVRLMVQLGRHYGSGPASLAEIAAEEELPRPYLEQLALGLREAGLVTSTRGARGGYELARPPDQIGMLEILRALEGPIAPMICVTDDPVEHVCGRTARCTVNLLWLRIRDAVAGALETLTLADFLPPRPIAAELVGARRHASAEAGPVPFGSFPLEPLAPAHGSAPADSRPNAPPETLARGRIGGEP